MDANFFYERLAGFRKILSQLGYEPRLAQAGVIGAAPVPLLLQMPQAIIGKQTLIALPDVHLGSGAGGDIFVDETPTNIRRLQSVLRTMRDYTKSDPFPTTLIQLGDWYDVWRAIGHDSKQSRFSPIENVAAFNEILSLDKQLGLAHVIGNHDASFIYARPDRRVADSARFRFGFALGGNRGKIFALHGHQADRIEGEPNTDAEQLAVWAGTLAATYISSEFRDLQELMDKRDATGALIWLGSLAAEAALARMPGGVAPVANWLSDLFGKARDDIPPAPRAALGPPNDGQKWHAKFVAREDRKRLVRMSVAACDKLYGAQASELQLLLLGHSHKPCFSWTPHPRTGRPVLVVDAGSFTYGQAQLLFGAGNTLAIFDIVPSGTPA